MRKLLSGLKVVDFAELRLPRQPLKHTTIDVASCQRLDSSRIIVEHQGRPEDDWS